MPSDRKRAQPDLARHPRPNVAVDLALLTAVPPAPGERVGHLAVLVQDRHEVPRGMALPGRFLRERQTVVDAIADTLREKVGLGVRSSRPILLGVFDDPIRDARAWTLSLAHALALPHEQLDSARGRLVRIDEYGDVGGSLPLLFDHGAIVREAAGALRERYESGPDPDGLLEAPFTLAQLRALHEAVLGEPLRKDTFNRRMQESLEPLADRSGTPTTLSSGGRPARLFVPTDRALPDLSDPRSLSPSSRRRLTLPRDHR